MGCVGFDVLPNRDLALDHVAIGGRSLPCSLSFVKECLVWIRLMWMQTLMTMLIICPCALHNDEMLVPILFASVTWVRP